MTLNTFMSNLTLNSSYSGVILADDYVLAVGKVTDVTDASEIEPGTFDVVEAGLKSVDGQLNPQEKTTGYIRRGQSTTKTGTQRTFSLDMDRYIGDNAQDMFDDFSMKYGTGNDCIVGYAYINRINGKGEKGLVSVIVNTDCSGSTEENSGLSVDLKSTSVKPVVYTWSKPE